MEQRKLKRDIVISVVDGKDLVGVYFADTDGSQVLFECSPKDADLLIKIWNRLIEQQNLINTPYGDFTEAQLKNKGNEIL